MQRYKLLTGLIVLAVFLFSTGAMAAGTKIGVFNANYVVAHSKRGQAANDALKALVNKKKAPLDKEKKSLTQTQETLKQAKNKKSSSFKKKLASFQQSFGSFQNHVKQTQQAIQKRRAELYRPIIKDLNKVIADYATKHSYSLILNATNDTVAYATKSLNLNDELVGALDKYEGE